LRVSSSLMEKIFDGDLWGSPVESGYCNLQRMFSWLTPHRGQ
jgi:hypothetical protein